MKNFITAIAVSLLLSCNDGTTVAGTAEDYQAERNKETSKQIYKAWITGDVSRIDTFFTEDFIHHNLGQNGSDAVGKDSVKYYLSLIHGLFDNFNVDVVSEASSADGNYHFSIIRMKGNIKKNPWGTPEGTEWIDSAVNVMKLRNGKVSERWSLRY